MQLQRVDSAPPLADLPPDMPPCPFARRPRDPRMSLAQTQPEDAAYEGPILSALSGLMSTVHAAPARRLIVHARENADCVPVICEGWAMAAIATPDGRRQVLSFLLPGDVVSLAYLFGPLYGRSVEAVTPTTYRLFRRADIGALLRESPAVMETFARLWFEECQRSEEALLDLGRRSADARIARLLLGLSRRLAQRGLMRGQTMAFPLRQRHLADATGLTPVHVCKVLGTFQRAGLIALEDRALTLRDPAGLRRAAELV